MVLFSRRKPHRKGDWSIEFLGSMFKLFMIAFPLGVSAFSLLAMRLQLGPFTGVLSETWREVTRKVGTSWNRLTVRSCRCSSATSQLDSAIDGYIFMEGRRSYGLADL